MLLAEVSVGANVMSFMDWLDDGPCDDDDKRLFIEFGHRLFKDGWKWLPGKLSKTNCFTKGKHVIYLRDDWMKAGYAAKFSGIYTANVADLRDLRGLNIDDVFAQLDQPR
jgi:hypothetical protein